MAGISHQERISPTETVEDGHPSDILNPFVSPHEIVLLELLLVGGWGVCVCALSPSPTSPPVFSSELWCCGCEPGVPWCRQSVRVCAGPILAEEQMARLQQETETERELQ